MTPRPDPFETTPATGEPERHLYLICYDIADPLRLQRIHRYLKQCALPVQYSVFLGNLRQSTLRQIYNDLAEMIDPEVDDVRIYPLSRNCEAFTFGPEILLDGTFLPDDLTAELLTEARRRGKQFLKNLHASLPEKPGL